MSVTAAEAQVLVWMGRSAFSLTFLVPFPCVVFGFVPSLFLYLGDFFLNTKEEISMSHVLGTDCLPFL